jgi:hypothetical protein
MPTTDPQQQQMNRMMEFMPFMFLMFSFQVASGLTVYWVVSNLYSILQQRIFVGWGTLPVPWNKSQLPALANGDSTQTITARESQPAPTRRRPASSRKRKGK